VKDVQLLEPLFEFSGACAGCGETPYIKLLTQLFGDRLFIANATGCSSIYGGNLPTTPYTVNEQGRGPDLVELAVRGQRGVWPGDAIGRRPAEGLCGRTASPDDADHRRRIGDGVLFADQATEAGIEPSGNACSASKSCYSPYRTTGVDISEIRNLSAVADALVRKSVWIVGGDGWAYDIGFGGLDHVLGSGHNINVLVLDTEVYSNTGGQMSKSTPRGAVAKFAAGGKTTSEERPRDGGSQLWLGLCRPSGDGRQRYADHQSIPGG
jgi:pyruvate-ferredoxin/flavodoxin oxidoreductase